MTSSLPADLQQAIVTSGYFPQFVAATVAQSVADETISAWVVQHETTFNRDVIHRHLTVLALTPTRLIVGHTDDGDIPGTTQAVSTVETVPLRQINSVSLTQVASRPERFGAQQDSPVDEAWLSVGWGVVRRVEIEPASCNDPECMADHGYSAQDVSDDLTLRVSAAADGAATVQQLIAFSSALQRATV